MGLFNNREQQGILAKLKERKYANAEEKGQLLKKLEQANPPLAELLWMLYDQDFAIREFLVQHLIYKSDKNTLQVLLNEATQSNISQEKQKYIFSLLGRVQPPGVISFISKAISSRKLAERRLAMEIVSQFQSIKKVFFVFEEALTDPEEEIRLRAVNKLVRHLGKSNVFIKLLALMDDPSEKIRHKIIIEMSHSESPELVSPFFNRLPHEPKQIQDYMISYLSRLVKRSDKEKGEISALLIPELASEHEISREVASRILAQLPNRREILEQFLLYSRGIAFWLRERVFRTIGNISENIVDDLIALLDEEDMSLRLDAMHLALYIRDKRLIPSIGNILHSPLDWWAKSLAIDILVKLQADNLVDYLQEYEEDQDLKASVISAYGESKIGSKINYLIDNLENPSGYIQLISLRALASLDHPEVKTILQEIAENSPVWTLREEAMRLAQNLGISYQVKERAEQKLDPNQELQNLKNLGFEMEDEHLNDTETTDNIASSRSPTTRRQSTVKPDPQLPSKNRDNSSVHFASQEQRQKIFVGSSSAEETPATSSSSVNEKANSSPSSEKQSDKEKTSFPYQKQETPTHRKVALRREEVIKTLEEIKKKKETDKIPEMNRTEPTKRVPMVGQKWTKPATKRRTRRLYFEPLAGKSSKASGSSAPEGKERRFALRREIKPRPKWNKPTEEENDS